MNISFLCFIFHILFSVFSNPGGVKPYAENLGEFLRGDKIENSAYEVRKNSEKSYLLQKNYCLFLFLCIGYNVCAV